MKRNNGPPLSLPGPGYYGADRPFRNAKLNLSVSKKGNASFASETKRFITRVPNYGMPGPTQYDTQLSLAHLDSHTLARDVTRQSATFAGTGRNNTFMQPAITITPDPGSYKGVAKYNAVGPRQSFNVKTPLGPETFRRVKSSLDPLITEAKRSNKSLSRFIIENDPSYEPPPSLVVEVPAEPMRETEVWPQNVSPARQYKTYLKQIKAKFNFDIPNTLDSVSKDINNEIQKVYAAQRQQGRLLHDSAPMLRRGTIPTKSSSDEAFIIASNTADKGRVAKALRSTHNFVTSSQQEMVHVGPGSYNVKDNYLSDHVIPGHTPLLVKASERFKTPRRKERVGPGTYEVSRMLTDRKSFLLNEDGKFLVN